MNKNSLPNDSSERDKELILKHYDHVLNEIKNTCLAIGRDPRTVKLMLVTKTVPSQRIEQSIQIGHTLFGENKIQELELKRRELFKYHVDFHFIGHLQSNKVKKCLDLTNFIHSVDRLAIAKEIQKYLEHEKRTINILVQVNTSSEPSKYGVSPEGLMDLIKKISLFDRVKIRGLMTLAKFTANEEEVRDCFKLLKKLSSKVENEKIPGVEMSELSMGMTSDYKIAIEEGSTIVRVGTAVFGQRPTSDLIYWPE